MDFKIQKAASSAADYTAPKAVTGLVYTKKAQKLITAGTATNGTMYYSLSKGESASWSTSIPTGTNVGTYNVYYYVEGDENHTGVGSKAAPIDSLEVKIILQTTNTDTGTADSQFGKLRLKAAKAGKTYITLSWTDTNNADGYYIYGRVCDGKKMGLIKTINSGDITSWTWKGLKKGTYYKMYVVSFKTEGTTKKILNTSKVIHTVTAGGKYGVAKSVKISKIGTKTISSQSNITATVKAKKTAQITASEVKGTLPIKRHVGIRYESSNTAVAKVSSKGVITGVKKGTCSIWVYAQNGVYRTIKVTVK